MRPEEHELAKQLKDAGFPQKENRLVAFPMAVAIMGRNTFGVKEKFGRRANDEYLAVPTLSELIEACGEEFLTLSRQSPGMIAEWKAYALDAVLDEAYLPSIGDTPEQAVTRLWLALNSKTRRTSKWAIRFSSLSQTRYTVGSWQVTSMRRCWNGRTFLN